MAHTPALRSGGRSRHTVNIAGPPTDSGTPTIAYTFTETTSAPSGATAGYKNDGLQKTLHAIFMNNNAGTCVFRFWGYHSFAQQWAALLIVDPADGGNNVIDITMAANTDAYALIPIEGIERIAVQCSTFAGSNNVTCYLGVNTI